MDDHIIPECYVDTKLVKVLCPPQSKRYNHQKGCNTVSNKMQNKFFDDFALGIVDKDKRILDYSKEFDIIFQTQNLELRKHKSKNHYLIFIIPAMENWLIENLTEVGATLSDFGLPNDFEKLKKITKNSKSEQLDPYSKNLDKLFRTLKEKKAKSVLILTYWIEYLKNNPYNADLEILKTKTTKIIN
ncbi:MAG: hypothetical protein EAZ97_10840 [Bacteroidetes bacterium]|nr:MAG: hypothetical protein EAZ97_10840 [Bacteroidota bacterium]